MATPDTLVVMYRELADWHQPQGQPQMRDRFLVLPAAPPLSPGLPAEAAPQEDRPPAEPAGSPAVAPRTPRAAAPARARIRARARAAAGARRGGRAHRKLGVRRPVRDPVGRRGGAGGLHAAGAVPAP